MLFIYCPQLEPTDGLGSSVVLNDGDVVGELGFERIEVRAIVAPTHEDRGHRAYVHAADARSRNTCHHRVHEIRTITSLDHCVPDVDAVLGYRENRPLAAVER